MTLEQLQLFQDVALHRSFSEAARLHHVSQSAVSQQIQELERLLGTRLVDRATRPLTLTSAGELYRQFCNDVLRLRREFEVSLERLKGRVEGTARVASIYSVGLSEMRGLETEFSRRWPDARVEVDYLRPEKVYEAVLAGRADLGLVSYPESRKELEVREWRKERMVVVVHPGHPLASRDVVEGGDLRGHPWVGFDEELPIAREVRRFLRDSGVDTPPVKHFDNIQTMKEAVAFGLGYSILPERILAADLNEGRLRAIALALPGLYRPLGVIRLRRRELNRAAESFLSLLFEGALE